jgi:dolichyl-phosphate-mannose--protein O-mannosyl transferase
MISMMRIERVMYLYHYFIALVTGMILFYLLFLYFFEEDIVKKDKVLLYGTIALAVEIVAVFAFFSPLTYGMPLDANEFMRRVWSHIWGLVPIYF